MKTTDEVATTHGSSAPRERVELDVGGMTCASCAMRVERALNRLDGVEATVNYATERASVAYDADRCDVDEMVGGVAALGYRASVRPPAGHVATGEHAIRTATAATTTVTSGRTTCWFASSSPRSSPCRCWRSR